MELDVIKKQLAECQEKCEECEHKRYDIIKRMYEDADLFLGEELVNAEIQQRKYEAQIEALEKLLVEPKEDSKESITFYVAECMEFPGFGELHKNIDSLEEAVKLYEAIPASRMNGIKGIGFVLTKGDEELEWELMSGDKISYHMLDIMTEIKENPLVQNAVKELEEILEHYSDRNFYREKLEDIRKQIVSRKRKNIFGEPLAVIPLHNGRTLIVAQVNIYQRYTLHVLFADGEVPCEKIEQSVMERRDIGFDQLFNKNGIEYIKWAFDVSNRRSL